MRFEKCPFYNLQSKKKLGTLIFVDNPARNLKKMFQVKNYNIRKQNKKNKKGQLKVRIIEEPKEELKRVHSRIKNLLERLDLPEYLHSGKKRRSYKTNADIHKDSNYLVNLDIASFYPSCTGKKVFDLFKDKLQTSPDIAFLLSNVCTVNGHLPTGSPVSQIIAFLVCFDMFEEIKEYAKKESIIFSVYVDDVTLSSDKEITKKQIVEVQKIIERNNFQLKKTKLKKFPQNKPKEVTGVVIHNKKLCVPNKRKQRIIELAKIKYPNEKQLRSLFGRITEVQYIEGSKTFEVLKVAVKAQLDKKSGSHETSK